MKIIVFDGVCGLCNGYVDFMLRRDKAHRFMFTTIQGSTAKQIGIRTDGSHEEWSIIYYDQGVTYERSEAVLRMLIDLSGWWCWLKIFMIFPIGFRDFIYKWVARNRYKWFGKKEMCRIPSADENQYFLP